MTNRTYFKPLYDFGSWLDEQLTLKNMTMKELSRLSGISPAAIACYRRNVSEPSYFSVSCICSALGYDVVVVPKERNKKGD